MSKTILFIFNVFVDSEALIKQTRKGRVKWLFFFFYMDNCLSVPKERWVPY